MAKLFYGTMFCISMASILSSACPSSLLLFVTVVSLYLFLYFFVLSSLIGGDILSHEESIEDEKRGEKRGINSVDPISSSTGNDLKVYQWSLHI